MVVIDRRNRLPLYIQLKEVIIQKIDNQIWVTGDTIPTERELQDQYNLSRTTVRQALTELVSEGVLERIQGKGTFVAAPKLEPLRPDVTSFTQDMNSQGKQVQSIILEEGFERCSKKIATALRIDERDVVYKLVRLRLVDQIIIGYHEAFLHPILTKHIDFNTYDFTKDSLYDCLEKEGIVWGESDETVEASLAGDRYAQLLRIENTSPILKLTRLTRLNNNRPLEYTTMVYRADKYKYSVKLR
ncbi:GntR family transcriptional regulator [Bacillus weihaiensis]|uniref:GntR family transcriptional regulator n=1 Tax=Bacillus weihaiensis TaxID=1547283 RepID=UPI002355A2C7|nr:GntR family transcriptional regulator [Bacillus weihaiensis]